MKALNKITKIFFILLLVGCGNSENNEEDELRLEDYEQTTDNVEPVMASTGDSPDDLKNKGIGPVKNLSVGEEIDEAMAAKGAELFKNMCSACHKMEKKFVGPAVAGVTERRTHEWIMNMILNPEQMIKEDPIAKRLMIESNMAIMADQNLEEEEARAILEYFRKYDQEN